MFVYDEVHIISERVINYYILIMTNDNCVHIGIIINTFKGMSTKK